MNPRGSRVDSADGHRPRRMELSIDLNIPVKGNSSDHTVHETQGETSSAPLIDIDPIDDDVIFSSPRSFAQARFNSRRHHGVSVPVIDVDSGNTEEHIPSLAFGCTRRRSALTSETVINVDQYINLESSWNSVNGNAMKPPEQSVLPAPTPPPEPICPICMNPFVESMSTKCGHVFCKSCIIAAITAQKKCPTCRRNLNARGIFRVYLPSTS